MGSARDRVHRDPEGLARDFFARLVAASREGEFDEVRRLTGVAPPGIGFATCARHLLERGLVEGAIAVLDAQYDSADEDEPRSQWIAEQLDSVRRSVTAVAER